MRVCFITGEYPPMQGGIADYTRNLASTLHDRGIEVSILTSTKAGGSSGEGPVVFAGSGIRDGDPWPVFATIERWNFRAWRQIWQHLRTVRPDVIHIQYQTSAYAMHPAIDFLPFWLRRRRERPAIVTTFHDLGVPYLFPKAGRLRQMVTAALVRGSDRTTVTNAEDWATACSMAGVTAAVNQPADSGTHVPIRIVPIGNSIPVNPPEGFDRSTWRAKLNAPAGEVLLSYFGFLNQSKGVETLLEAISGLISGGAKLRLLMVGADVGVSDPTNLDYRQKVVRQIGDLGLDERVIWTGFATPREVSGHLLSTDLCALPYKDGASFRRTTLLTALAHGLPVISTRMQNAGQARFVAGAVEQQIVDGKHALLVPPNDAAGLREAIEKLIRQPDLRRRLAEDGRELAESFSWPFIAQQTLSIYEEMQRR